MRTSQLLNIILSSRAWAVIIWVIEAHEEHIGRKIAGKLLRRTFGKSCHSQREIEFLILKGCLSLGGTTFVLQIQQTNFLIFMVALFWRVILVFNWYKYSKMLSLQIRRDIVIFCDRLKDCRNHGLPEASNILGVCRLAGGHVRFFLERKLNALLLQTDFRSIL